MKPLQIDSAASATSVDGRNALVNLRSTTDYLMDSKQKA